MKSKNRFYFYIQPSEGHLIFGAGCPTKLDWTNSNNKKYCLTKTTLKNGYLQDTTGLCDDKFVLRVQPWIDWHRTFPEEVPTNCWSRKYVFKNDCYIKLE